jgi:hypothetical protein
MKTKFTRGDWVMLVLFLAGIGWAGSNDFDYRKGQVDKELLTTRLSSANPTALISKLE